MPPIPEPNISSESLYGTCLDIYNRTDDSYSIVDEFPDPRTLDWNMYQGWPANDDFVMSDPNIPDINRETIENRYVQAKLAVPVCIGIAALWALYRWWKSYKKRGLLGYKELKV